ncbi:sodium/hydrogen exchanger [Natronorubrum tibetense GA33]|uniref:Sodium/hydrogen exchanger n=2 Tax=Natronorubrum tibetense TaxID=63128 RepID=L9W9K1_9EURY|nr:sodium/hydrogen exchanger [Natronorubrum tibetense GA33]
MAYSDPILRPAVTSVGYGEMTTITLIVVSSVLVAGVLLALAGVGIKRRRSATSADETREEGFSPPSPQLSLFDTEDVDDARAIDPRILLPVTVDQANSDRLFDLACSIKHRYGDEPIHLFTVCSDTRDEPNDGTAADEITAFHDGLAEVGRDRTTAVQTGTSRDDDVAESIVRTAHETDADLLVMDWDGTRPVLDASDGRTIDRVLSRTDLPVYLAQIDDSLAEIDRVHVVVPRQTDHHEGFYEAIYNVKQLASVLEAGISVSVFEQNVQQYRTLFDLVEIDIPAEFSSVASWRDLQSSLETETTPEELIVTLAVREGEIGWDDELRTVSNRFADAPARSLALFFLREDEPDHDDRFLRTE